MVANLAALLVVVVVVTLVAVLLWRDAVVRAKLEREKRRTEALYAFGQRLAAMEDVEPLAQVILAGVTELTGYDAGAVYVVGESGRSMRRAACFGVDEAAIPERLRLADPREVLQLGLPEVVVELTHGDRVLGFLTLARAPGGRPADEDAAEVERLAAQSAVALAHAIALRHTRRLLDLNRAVLDSTREGITMVDLSGRLVFANRMMETFYASFGVPAEGMVWDRLIATARKTTTPDRYIADFARIIEAPELVYENEFTMADSGRSFRGVTEPVHDSTGRLIGRIFSLREVSAEREADRAKDEFVASVSHELRTPLTSMFGFTEVLLGGDAGELTDDQRRYLEIVQRSTERLMRLVGDLLFIGQIDSGQLALEPRPTDVSAVAEQVVEAARPLARMRGIDLVLQTDSVPELVGDPARLAQLTDNLLSNALKFTPEGGRVVVAVQRAGDRCILEVADSGPGIPASERERVFERFFRSSEATEQAIQGTGLGLAISKAIVDAHGGTITLVEPERPGATFRVELPLPAA